MPCKTVVSHITGKPRLCGEPSTTYSVSRGTYLQLSVSTDLCLKHAARAEHEGYVLLNEAPISNYVARTNRSTHCQS